MIDRSQEVKLNMSLTKQKIRRSMKKLSIVEKKIKELKY